MGSARRAKNYDRQNGRTGTLTPPQMRRWLHKYNQINDPRRIRAGSTP